MKKDVIAIDGPSGVGKSTVARLLAHKLGWTYLDTGAMYRAITWAWIDEGKTATLLSDKNWLDRISIDFKGTSCFVNARDVTQEIRTERVTGHVSHVASIPEVRHYLTRQQRALGQSKPCVLDGRDIGTVVFPDATLKIFLSAAASVRAQRRWLELGADKAGSTLEEVEQQITARDLKDQTRTHAPLLKADDAIEIDTGPLTAQQVADRICELINRP